MLRLIAIGFLFLAQENVKIIDTVITFKLYFNSK